MQSAEILEVLIFDNFSISGISDIMTGPCVHCIWP